MMKDLLSRLVDDPVQFLLCCHVAVPIRPLNLGCVALLYVLHLSVKPFGRSMLRLGDFVKEELMIMLGFMLSVGSELHLSFLHAKEQGRSEE